MLELHVLRSGDKGSCAAVRLAGAEEFVCVDCGITGTTFVDACAQTGLIPFKVQAFLITHCHSNQVKGLKSTLTWLQKRGVAPQVYVEPGVLAASPVLQELQGIADVCEFHTKQPFWVGDVCVRPFRTFHNNEDKGSCYNFRFETRATGDEQVDSLVLLSDVGVLSREAQGELPHARLLAIEANYDTGLLDEAAQANPQVRFAVDVRGNFSNAQAASTVQAYAWPGLKDVVALYLSRQYNAPTRATAAIEAALEQAGCKARVACASPDETLSVLPEGESADDGNGTAPEKPAVENAAAEMPCVAGGVANMAAPEASVSEMPGCNASVETPALETSVTVAAGACPVKDEPVSEQLAAGEALVEPIASGTLAGEGFIDKESIAEAPTLEAALGAAASETCVFETPAHEVGVETTASERSFESSVLEEPAPEQPAVTQPAPEEPAVAQPAPEQPAPEQSAPEQPASEEPAPEQPAHEPPALEAPAPYSAPEDILLPEQAREMGYVDLRGLLDLWVQQGCLTESPAISAEDLLRALIAADMLDSRDMTPTDKGIELGVWAAFEAEGLAPVFAARMADRLWEHVQALL